MFTLEALSAKHGDALLLHYGTAAKPKLVLIDAGPAGVWKASVRPRLEALRAERGVAKLPIRMVMVSHVDADHITGVIDLFKELRKAKDDGGPQLWDVATLWHNSFKDGLEVAGGSAPASVAAMVDVASLGEVALPKGVKLASDTMADLASIAQGGKLRDQAAALGVAPNDAFAGKLVMAPAAGVKKVVVGDGLTFRVLAPSAARIDALKKDWAKQTKGKKATPAQLAAYLDDSVYNLSSIVVIAEFGTKRMLLTGDARGDDILAALKAAKLLKAGKLKVNVLKLQHHGSDRDVAPDFFETVVADHYVVSADGKYGNPDVDTLKMLTTARGNAAYTIWLTNAVPRVTAFFKADRKKPGRKYEVVVRGKNEPSVSVEL